MTTVETPKHKLRIPAPRKGAVNLLIGTRKGAFLLTSDRERRDYPVKHTHVLGEIVYHVVSDPRSKRLVLMASQSAEHGPRIHRSEDGGKTFKAVRRLPQFDEPRGDLQVRRVQHVFWLGPGHASEPGVWYAGTCPQGLFRSRDGGVSWRPVAGLHNDARFDAWTGGRADLTPDGPKLHSVCVDPRDSEHLYVAMSSGGVFESGNAGRSWAPLNEGSQLEHGDAGEHEFGQDCHLLSMCATNPDILWQQGRCGVYRMDREVGRWQHVGENLPREVGDIGFPVLPHPRDPDCAWVFPMDGSERWSRTSPGGAPAAYRSRDGGKRWARQDKGLPSAHAYWTVKRQCMAHDAHDPLGLYLGTSSGEIWASTSAGGRWKCIARHLPQVYSVEVLGVVQ